MPNKEQQKGIVERKQQNINDELLKGTNHLLVIGIDKYQYCTPLNNAVKDATDFVEVLTKRYNFNKKHVIFIKDKEANKDNIIDAFRQLKKKVNPPDNLVIYYSGHGELDEDFGESYLVTVDSRKGKIGDYLSHEQIVKFIRAIETQHTLLILDACFAGTFLVNRRSTKALEKDPSRYVIASGRKEYASDGVAGTNSPFAAALLEKLRQNEASLLASDLAQYVMKQTIKATREAQRPIHNPLQIKEDKGGQFAFHPKNNKQQKKVIQVPSGMEKKLRALELEIARLKEGNTNQLKGINPIPHIISDPNIFTDPRDGQTYKTVKLKDGNTWMAQNLNFDVGEGCWIYGDDSIHEEVYGRLYRWEVAHKACPDGWHLPSDDEWWRMISYYGTIYNEKKGQQQNTNDADGKEAFKALVMNKNIGFSARLGGLFNSYDGNCELLGDTGYYWSATKKDTSFARIYYFARIQNHTLARYDHSILNGASCRCIKD